MVFVSQSFIFVSCEVQLMLGLNWTTRRLFHSYFRHLINCTVLNTFKWYFHQFHFFKSCFWSVQQPQASCEVQLADKCPAASWSTGRVLLLSPKQPANACSVPRPVTKTPPAPHSTQQSPGGGRWWEQVGRRKECWEPEGEDRLQHPQPLLLLPRAVHAALQPKQSPTCLRTSRRGHENGLCCQSGSSVTASPVDVRELSWLPCRVSWWSSRWPTAVRSRRRIQCFWDGCLNIWRREQRYQRSARQEHDCEAAGLQVVAVELALGHRGSSTSSREHEQSDPPEMDFGFSHPQRSLPLNLGKLPAAVVWSEPRSTGNNNVTWENVTWKLGKSTLHLENVTCRISYICHLWTNNFAHLC